VLPQRVGQGGDLGRIEMPARLEGVRVDLIDRDVDEVRGVERGGFVSSFLAPKKCFQPAAEASLIHVR
jgi:hypothetical protein